jgi:hypothetical protein
VGADPARRQGIGASALLLLTMSDWRQPPEQEIQPGHQVALDRVSMICCRSSAAAWRSCRGARHSFHLC